MGQCHLPKALSPDHSPSPGATPALSRASSGRRAERAARPPRQCLCGALLGFLTWPRNLQGLRLAHPSCTAGGDIQVLPSEPIQAPNTGSQDSIIPGVDYPLGEHCHILGEAQTLKSEKSEFLTYMFFDILQEMLYFSFLNHQWS